MFANLGTALSSTMIQDISPAKYRGRLFGISVLLITVVSSVAPFVVGLISDQFGAEPRGLLWAMLLVVVPALILSALSISFTNKQYKITAANLAIN
jgi:MFS family permease